MFSDQVTADFGNAALAVSKEISGVSRTGNNLKRLDFFVDIEGKKKSFSAIEQNPQKVSGAAIAKRSGHDVVQIRDNDDNQLVGYVDVTARRFIPYSLTAGSVELDAVERDLGRDAFKPGDIQTTAAPVLPEAESRPKGVRRRAA